MVTNKKIQNLIRAFVKNISADKTQPKNTNTVYGTVFSRGGTKQVLLDGGTEPTACVFNVEADEGDRVVCSVQNHSWSVDSNVTKPASSPTTVKGRSDVESIIDEHVISLSGIDVYYQREQPTEPSGGFKDGDTWYELDANGYVSKLHVWENGEWVDTQFDGGNILRAKSITANEIASNTITANKINLTDVFAQDITASGTITGATLIGGSIDIGNGAFSVDSSGNINATSGKIGGMEIIPYGFVVKSPDNTKELFKFYGKIWPVPWHPVTTFLESSDIEIYAKNSNTASFGQLRLRADNGISLTVPENEDLDAKINLNANIILTEDGVFKSTRSDIGFSHTHGKSGTKISFGVGSGGINRGVYDDTSGNWMICRRDDTTAVYFGGGLYPGTSEKYNIGGAGHLWQYIVTNYVRFYRGTAYYYQFGGTPTANRTITFQNASGTVAFTSSDARLKRNIENTELSGLDMMNSIKVRQFDWLNDETAGYNKGRHQTIGFVADELEELDPFFIVNGSGGEDEDGNINPKCVDTFYMLGYMAKAIQELSAKVDELSRDIEDLIAE